MQYSSSGRSRRSTSAQAAASRWATAVRDQAHAVLVGVDQVAAVDLDAADLDGRIEFDEPDVGMADAGIEAEELEPQAQRTSSRSRGQPLVMWPTQPSFCGSWPSPRRTGRPGRAGRRGPGRRRSWARAGWRRSGSNRPAGRTGARRARAARRGSSRSRRSRRSRRAPAAGSGCSAAGSRYAAAGR